jgi:hypothetical protein
VHEIGNKKQRKLVKEHHNKDVDDRLGLYIYSQQHKTNQPDAVICSKLI